MASSISSAAPVRLPQTQATAAPEPSHDDLGTRIAWSAGGALAGLMGGTAITAGGGRIGSPIALGFMGVGLVGGAIAGAIFGPELMRQWADSKR